MIADIIILSNMRVILIILDGWGAAPPSFGNAISTANTPTLDALEKSHPSLLLQASGIAVGLPWGEEGNSEVGHLNLGAGRIILQYIPRIISSIRDGSFFENPALKNAALHVKSNDSTLHLMGLVSSGSVHSYIDHLYALLELAKRERIANVFLHIFTDGKDCPPNEAAKFIPQLEERLRSQGLGKIATIIGRTYAMDRNENWEYTQKAYELLTEGKGEVINNAAEYLQKSYAKRINDQYIEPAIVNGQLSMVNCRVKDADAVIFFNFREDSARQLTHAFLDKEFNYFARKKLNNLFFTALTHYYPEIPLVNVAFPPPDIAHTLAETLSKNNKTQLHIAETEKYAHATYFFSGLIEKPYYGEERILIPSYGARYDEHPEMRAEEITDKAIENLDRFDFILINFANSDMLAHTGNMQATIKGIETVDSCIKRILEKAGGEAVVIITADHGNAEEIMELKTGRIKTEHTANPVPLYVVIPNKGMQRDAKGEYNKPLYTKKISGVLADVAPTILEIMGIPAPKEMTGQSLLPLLASPLN